MGVETGAAHDFVVAEIGVALNQLRLEALRVKGDTRVSRTRICGDKKDHGGGTYFLGRNAAPACGTRVTLGGFFTEQSNW